MSRKFKSHHPAPPVTLGILVAVLLVAAMAMMRLGLLRNNIVPIGFGVPIVAIAWFRNRLLLWGSVIACSAMVAAKYFGIDAHAVQADTPLTHLAAALMLEIDLLVIAAMGHIWISLQDSADRRTFELEETNAGLALREEEIARQNQQLDQRRCEAEEANVRKTRFLAAVSHDVRTPANAISLLADLIRRTAANPALAGEVPELTEELYASAVFLVDLLTDILDIARFDSGKMELSLSDFSLGAMMEEERNRLAPLARQKNIELRWIEPREPIWLRADRIKLSRVLGNLVGNAIKFTDRGEVCIEVERAADGGVKICVKDTGIGIAPDHQRDIFDEFVQLGNPERDRNKGTGLGLSICKRLVESMHARLDLQSVPGQGSTFMVTLPPDNVIAPPALLSNPALLSKQGI